MAKADRGKPGASASGPARKPHSLAAAGGRAVTLAARLLQQERAIDATMAAGARIFPSLPPAALSRAGAAAAPGPAPLRAGLGHAGAGSLSSVGPSRPGPGAVKPGPGSQAVPSSSRLADEADQESHTAGPGRFPAPDPDDLLDSLARTQPAFGAAAAEPRRPGAAPRVQALAPARPSVAFPADREDRIDLGDLSDAARDGSAVPRITAPLRSIPGKAQWLPVTLVNSARHTLTVVLQDAPSSLGAGVPPRPKPQSLRTGETLTVTPPAHKPFVTYVLLDQDEKVYAHLELSAT
jgi:hypothetical protein